MQESETKLVFSEHLAIHVFQLPNFKKGSDELTDSLDRWLYFLNNGEGLSPDNLPESIRIPEVEEAMSVLKALTEEEREWHRYFDREKARRDALNWQLSLERAQTEVERAQAEVERVQAKAERVETEAEAKAERIMVEGLVGQVRLCEELLNLPPIPDEQLHAMQPDDLRQLVGQLRQSRD